MWDTQSEISNIYDTQGNLREISGCIQIRLFLVQYNTTMSVLQSVMNRFPSHNPNLFQKVG
jgi:hypothetical protein